MTVISGRKSGGIGLGHGGTIRDVRGGAVADPWTEGPNLFDDGGFEGGGDPTLPWGNYNGTEVLEFETGVPIAGTASLHYTTEGGEGVTEGIDWKSGVVTARDRVRVRFKLKNADASGYLYVILEWEITETFAQSQWHIVWEGVPPSETEAVSVDFIVPDSALEPATGTTGQWRPRLWFITDASAVDVLIDDVYVGVLSPL